MSDTPHPDPLDEQASDLFDAGADAPGDEPELGARLDEFRALRDALADVPPAPDAERTGAIAAALALFDQLATEAPGGGAVAAGGAMAAGTAADDEPAVVTPLRPAAPAGPGSGAGARHRRTLALLSAAASVVVVLGVVALVTRGSGRSGVDSPTAAVIGEGGGGFSQAKDAAGGGAPAAESAGDSALAGGSDTTAAAAASASVAAAVPSTSVRAASSVAATTTAATTGGFASAPPEEPTSTTDGRDTTTTAAAGTTSPPTTTSTNVDAAALPYLGELTAVDDLAAALRALPPFDGADAGAPIRAQLADGVCDLRPYGTPLAVLRWNGRDSVVMRSADAPIVQLIPLDGCNPIVQLDAPS